MRKVYIKDIRIQDKTDAQYTIYAKKSKTLLLKLKDYGWTWLSGTDLDDSSLLEVPGKTHIQFWTDYTITHDNGSFGKSHNFEEVEIVFKPYKTEDVSKSAQQLDFIDPRFNSIDFE